MQWTPRDRIGLAYALWGWTPHKTQKEWLLCEAKTKVAACGRRWGKTESQAVDVATVCLVEPGTKQMIVSPTYDQSRLMFDEVERRMLSVGRIRRRVTVVKTPYPTLKYRGSVVMARTADEDGRNLRGHSADRVVIDEAAYVRDAVVDAVVRPMLADTDGSLVLISTPFGRNHFYRSFVSGGSAAEVMSFQFPSWTNPHISAEYVEREKGRLSQRQFAVEYGAEFLEADRAVFLSWVIDRARGTHLPDERTPVIVAGIDWARYSDYTAVVVLAVAGGVAEVVELHRFNGMSWEQQVDRVAGIVLAAGVQFALSDQTGVGDPLLEQLQSRLCALEAGIGVEGLVFSNASKRELVERLALGMEQGTIGIGDDPVLLSELDSYEFEISEAGNVLLNARSGHNDDLVTALALAARAAGAYGAEWSVQAAPIRREPVYALDPVEYVRQGAGVGRRW
jgi:phage FluMu gp28-like protein